MGIVIIFSSIFLIINSPAILWYVYMVIGIVCLLLAFNAKSFQKFVLKKAELLLDKSFRTGIVEYHFDAEGIETISQMGYSKIIGLHLKSTVLWDSIYMLNEKIIKWF